MMNRTLGFSALLAVVGISIVFGMVVGGKLNAPQVALASPRTAPIRLAPAQTVAPGMNSFADIVERSMPAVVSVRSTQLGEDGKDQRQRRFLDSPWHFFFGEPEERPRDRHELPDSPRRARTLRCPAPGHRPVRLHRDHERGRDGDRPSDAHEERSTQSPRASRPGSTRRRRCSRRSREFWREGGAAMNATYRVLLFTLVLTVLSSPITLACVCEPPLALDPASWKCLPPGGTPTVDCDVALGRPLIERAVGQTEKIPVSWTFTNLALPEGTEFEYEIDINCAVSAGAGSATTLAKAKQGQATSCALTGGGTCGSTLSVPGIGSVALDPVGTTAPKNPIVFSQTATIEVDCPSCTWSSICQVELTVRDKATGLAVCGKPLGSELLPCGSYGDCGAPVIESDTPVICAENEENVPVVFRVIRNQFPAGRLPLTATIVPSQRPGRNRRFRSGEPFFQMGTTHASRCAQIANTRPPSSQP